MSGTVTSSMRDGSAYCLASASRRSAAEVPMAGSSCPPTMIWTAGACRAVSSARVDEVEAVGDLLGRGVPGVGDAEAPLVHRDHRAEPGDRADQRHGHDVGPLDRHELGDDRAQRAADHRQRAAEAEPGAEGVVGGGELGGGPVADRAEHVHHGVLVAAPHRLLGARAAGAGLRQAEVDPPRVQPVQGEGGGERGLRARRVHQVPGDDDGCAAPLVGRRYGDERDSGCAVGVLHAVQYTGRCTVRQCREDQDSGPG